MLSFFSATLAAQPVSWQRTYGSDLKDVGNTVIRTSDSGFLIAAYVTDSTGDIANSGAHPSQNGPLSELWISRLDKDGDIIWKKCYGGSGSEKAGSGGGVLSPVVTMDFFLKGSMQQTSDGGFIVAATVQCYNSGDGDISGYMGGVTDGWVFKIDGSGNLQWQRTLGGAMEDGISQVLQTPDGGYLAMGTTFSGTVTGYKGKGDIFLTKLDSGGNISWQQCLGDSLRFEYGYTIEPLPGGGYIIGAFEEDAADMDALVIRTDNNGNQIWAHTYGSSWPDAYTSVKRAIDGNYIMAASVSEGDGDVAGSGFHGGMQNTDIWVVKLDTAGNILWKKCFGGSLSEISHKLELAPDGRIIVFGATSSDDGDVTGHHPSPFGPAEDAWLLQLSASGSLLSQKCFGGTSYEEFIDGVLLPDGGVAATGYSTSEDGDLTGLASNNIWLVRTQPLQTTAVDDPVSGNPLSVYPNPSQETFYIRSGAAEEEMAVVVTDIRGSSVYNATAVIGGGRQLPVTLSGQPSGVYLLSVTGAGQRYHFRLVKQ